MTPEAKVKAKVVAQLKVLGAMYFFPMSAGYAAGGTADIVGCYKGRYFSIECKAGKNKPTPLQERHLEQVRQAGGIALVVSEVNIHEITEKLLFREEEKE